MARNWELYSASGTKALQSKDLSSAENMFLAALEESEDFEEHDPRIAHTLESLAEVYYRMGNYDLAGKYCHRVLEMYERTLGTDHPDVGVLAHNLAMLHHMQFRYMEAEPLYKKAMTIRTKALGSKHPEVMRLLQSYADLLEKTHRQAEAEHLKQCIDGMSSGRWTRSGRWSVFSTTGNVNYGVEVPQSDKEDSSATSNVAMQQIRRMANQAKAGTELPPQPPPLPQTKRTGNHDGAIRPATKAPTPAATKERPPVAAPKAPQHRSATLQPQHAPAAAAAESVEAHFENFKSFRSFAEQAQKSGNLVVAEQLWRNTLSEAEHFGMHDPRLAFTLDSLADNLMRQKKYDEAEIFVRRAIDIKVNAVGRDHVAVAHSTSALAKLFYSKGDYKQAVSLAKECIRIYEVTTGPEHPDTACAVYNLALIYHFKNAIHDAEKSYQRAIAIRRKTLGEQHPDTVKAHNNYNKLLALKQKDAERSKDQMIISGTWRVLELPPEGQLWRSEEE